MENRFRFSRARTRFDCFDCQDQINIQMQFAFDNMRNVRICEPCFYRLSKLAPSGSPVNQESHTFIPPKEETCQECQTEAVSRRLKKEIDTIEGWLACLIASPTLEDSIACWNDCDKIAWDRTERATLGFAYVQHLAQLKSVETWGKEISRVFTPSVADYVPPPF